MESLRIIGVLCAFAETGTEGIHWTFLDNSMVGYDALNILADGDYLFIEDGKGGIEWEGTIHIEYNRCKKPCPFGDGTGHWQRVHNCTVHGLQKGVRATTWFKWFVEERPAVLIKKVS